VVEKPPTRKLLQEADDDDVMITEAPVSVVQKKVYGCVTHKHVWKLIHDLKKKTFPFFVHSLFLHHTWEW
jgi:hypothetical protein